MKRPQHMTMNELVALPVITDAAGLAERLRDGTPEHGGTFADDDGFLWRTLRTEAGWARYAALLLVLVGARHPCAASSTAGQIIGTAERAA